MPGRLRRHKRNAVKGRSWAAAYRWSDHWHWARSSAALVRPVQSIFCRLTRIAGARDCKPWPVRLKRVCRSLYCSRLQEAPKIRAFWASSRLSQSTRLLEWSSITCCCLNRRRWSFLLNAYVNVMTLLLAQLASLSFTTGIFPFQYKLGHLILLLKKPGLCAADPPHYPQMTNLCTFSKVLQKLALVHLYAATCTVVL